MYRYSLSTVYFINSYSEPIKISIKDIDGIYGDESTQRLYEDIIKCNLLTDEKYSELLKAFPFRCEGFPLKSISESKMRLMIINGPLCMNLDNLRYIRTNYPKLAVLFAKHNMEEYMSLIGLNEEEYQEDEFLETLITNKDILSKFLTDSEAPMERKLIALARGADNWGTLWLKSTLKSLKLVGYLDLLGGKTVTFEKTPGNKALLDIFLSKKWIYGYDSDEKEENLYRATGKKYIEKR